MNTLLLILGIILVVIALFFIFREMLLWYWRLNDIVNKLDSILTELKKISGKEAP